MAVPEERINRGVFNRPDPGMMSVVVTASCPRDRRLDGKVLWVLFFRLKLC